MRNVAFNWGGTITSVQFLGTPRQADLMLVAGTVTRKMAPRVRRLHGYHVVKGVHLPLGALIVSCVARPGQFVTRHRVHHRKSLCHKFTLSACSDHVGIASSRPENTHSNRSGLPT